jgi:hypothetical protein
MDNRGSADGATSTVGFMSIQRLLARKEFYPRKSRSAPWRSMSLDHFLLTSSQAVSMAELGLL